MSDADNIKKLKESGILDCAAEMARLANEGYIVRDIICFAALGKLNDKARGTLAATYGFSALTYPAVEEKAFALFAKLTGQKNISGFLSGEYDAAARPAVKITAPQEEAPRRRNPGRHAGRTLGM